MDSPYDIAVPVISAIEEQKVFLQKFRDVDRAIRDGKLEQLLPHVMEGGVNLSKDPLLSVVIAYGKNKLAIELMGKIPPENLKDGNFNEDTALHVAAARGDERVVEALVEKNKSLLEARNKQREIPLHKAALFGRRRIFWKLVEYGGNVDANREDGATMLHCAVMGNAPELALEIAMIYPKQMTRRNSNAATPLQLLMTIPEAFQSQSNLGSLESLIYEWIPLVENLNERHERHVELEKLSVDETSYPRFKDDESLQFIARSPRFPPNYATFLYMLELAYIPVRWTRLLVFNILKQLSSRIEYLELQKKNHIQTTELIAFLARDPDYWEFTIMGRVPPPDMSNAFEHPPGMTDPKPKPEPEPEPGKESKEGRWDESPLTLGAKMGLHEFVGQILTVCPQSATYPDTEGKNVLQVAIQHGQEKIVEIIESMASGNNPILPSWLLSAIEIKTKNTILHFAAEETVKENFPTLQMQYELQWFEMVKRLVPKDLEYSRNKDEKTAIQLFNENHKNMVQKGKEQLMEMGKTCSSLVAAVVFASSFSIPGEKDANNNPVFLHKIAFKVFSHSYVIGLSCAATALVLFLTLLTSPYRVQDFRRSLPTKYFFANASFFVALMALLVAFTCNIYLNIYGGERAESKDIVPLVCELTIFPVVCTFVLLYRGSTFGFGSFMHRVWR